MLNPSVFQVFERIEKISSRNEMVDLLVGFFKSLDVTEAQIYSYLLQGRVSPLFVDREFNFSERSVLKVLNNISEMYELGLDVFDLRSKLGDAGLVAYEVVKSVGKESSEIGIRNLYDSLWEIINTEGTNSVKLKSDIFSDLILKSSPVDAKFLTRIVSGKLRLGCSVKTILDTFSFLLAGDKSARGILDNAYGVITDLGFVANLVCEESENEEKLRKLSELKPVLGIPILPRLVERVSSFKDIPNRFPDGGVLQPKFDGLRCQIHKGVEYSNIHEKSIWVKYIDSEKGNFGLFEKSKEGEGIKLFSRNLNDITDMFPEIVEEISLLKAKSIILDGEIIGWNERANRFIPFQETMQRKRKYGIEEKVKSVPVKYFAFDLLYLNGVNYATSDLKERLSCLSESFVSKEGLLNYSENIFFKDDVVDLERHFQNYVSEGLEGIILKKLEGGYLPGVRNFDWIKVKKSIESQVVDTIDAVVLGYYYGSGKKTDFGMGSLLIGVYNPDEDVFESVGKLGTGFTDSDWGVVAKRLAPLEMKYKGENVQSELKADVWVQPDVVVSVEADEISKSSVHLAGKSKLGFGLSLRFPRLISFDRDKLPEDSTSTPELIEMWNMSFGSKDS
jgi:DNA ligase 1